MSSQFEKWSDGFAPFFKAVGFLCSMLINAERKMSMWNEVKAMMIIFVLPMILFIACLTVLPNEFGIDPTGAFRDGSKSLQLMSVFLLSALGVLPIIAILFGWYPKSVIANCIVSIAFIIGAMNAVSIFNRLFV